MTDDTVSAAWITQRRILETVRAAPGGGIHRAELEQTLGAPWGQIWPAARGIYGRKLIDFCGPYMVAVPRSATRTRPTSSSAIMCGPRPPTAEDRAAVERFGAELERRAQLQLVPNVRRLAAELAEDGQQ